MRSIGSLVLLSVILSGCGELEEDDMTILRGTNLGNTQVLHGRNVQDSQPLINVSLPVISEDKALDNGNWVLTVTAAPVSAADKANPDAINQALMRVTLGEGGASTTIEVSASPGFSMQIPGGVVKVDAVWDNVMKSYPSDLAVAGFTNPATGNPLFFPDVKVNAFIHRGTSAAKGYRSYLLGPVTNTHVITGDVPRLANAWGMHYIAAASEWNAAGCHYFLRNSSAIFAEWLGTDMNAAKKAGQSIVIPSSYETWLVQNNTGGDFTSTLARLWFALNL